MIAIGNEYQESRKKSAFSVEFIPSSYKQAINCPENKKWQTAIKKEWDSMFKNDVWEVVDVPIDRKCVRSKWVENGNLLKFKSRLVAMGCTQVEGVATYAPTKIFNKSDVDLCAFLQASLDEEIYMTLPDGFKDVYGVQKALKLKKSIYGLKQSSREFHGKLANILITLGWKQFKSDSCMFMKNSEIIIHHVDDLLFGSSSVESNLITNINKHMRIMDQGHVRHYLKMKIDYNLKSRVCKISQPAYVQELLEEFNLENIQTKRTPLCPHTILDKVELNEEEKIKMQKLPYRELLGRINYLACTSRPDLSIAVTRLAPYSNCYGSLHWNQLIHVIQYLKYSRNDGIFLIPNDDGLQAFSDSDWGGDRPTRRSTTGYIIKFCGSILMWKSTLQKSVAHSHGC